MLPRLSLFLLACCLAGCAANSNRMPTTGGAPSLSAAAPGSPADSSVEAVSRDANGLSGAAQDAVLTTAVSVPRKIIYTATLDMTVEDLTGSGKKLLSLVQKHHGYVASAEVGGDPGAPRRGVWKLRVPVGEFDPFRSDLEALGAVQSNHLDSQDVTEEYYDVAGHIKNKRVEEQRLLDHLRHSTGTLTDILSVERELSRVRGEIEQLQGRLRLLANQTELTTITVTLREVQGFVPAKGTSFLAEANTTLQGSLDAMRELAKGLALALIALAPWGLALGIMLTPFLILAYRQGAFRRFRLATSRPDEPRV